MGFPDIERNVTNPDTGERLTSAPATCDRAWIADAAAGGAAWAVLAPTGGGPVCESAVVGKCNRLARIMPGKTAGTARSACVTLMRFSSGLRKPFGSGNRLASPVWRVHPGHLFQSHDVEHPLAGRRAGCTDTPGTWVLLVNIPIASADGLADEPLQIHFRGSSHVDLMDSVASNRQHVAILELVDRSGAKSLVEAVEPPLAPCG